MCGPSAFCANVTANGDAVLLGITVTVCAVAAYAGTAVAGVTPAVAPSIVTARPCGWESIVNVLPVTAAGDGRTYVGFGVGDGVAVGVGTGVGVAGCDEGADVTGWAVDGLMGEGPEPPPPPLHAARRAADAKASDAATDARWFEGM